jgi:hypothetical protein
MRPLNPTVNMFDGSALPLTGSLFNQFDLAPIG